MAKLMRPRRLKRSPTMPNASAGKSEYLTRKQIVDSKLRVAVWRRPLIFAVCDFPELLATLSPRLKVRRS